jgi:hypothetical protein
MKTISTRELLAATTNIPVAGVSDEKPCCSVKEAAARIERSASTVYRLRRTPGPIRFVVSGRRIYIETDSLDEYIAGHESTDAVCNTRATGLALTQPVPKDPIGANALQQNSVVESEDHQATPLRSETSCGQRDLLIRPGRSAFIGWYVA